MTEASLLERIPRPGRFRLRSKITFPYAILAVLMGAVAAYLMTEVVVGRFEERFSNQLLEAGRQAADSVVRQEQKHLETWRLISFTEGLADAVQAADSHALASIAGLAALNACQDAVDVLDEAGNPIFSAHRALTNLAGCQDYDFDPWPVDYSQWEPVKKVSAGQVDSQGDKFAGLALVDGVWALYTAGPILNSNGDRVGILLVGTYLDVLVRQLKTDALADSVLYAADGRVLATSFPSAGGGELAITADQFRQALDSQDQNVYRGELEIGDETYAQVLGAFEIRGGEDMGVIGTLLPTQWILTSASPARNWLILIFGLAVVVILLMGNFLASRIVRPVYNLVNASKKVALGDLTQQVEVDSGDEIGTLSRFFNRMVDGLQDRERVKDLFGRYVGDEVADEILQGNIDIGGRRVEASVLFSDIRGFTALSERSDPSELVASLQEYFTAMISEVEIQHGLINKFGGDSILALFGAPVHNPDHAQLAVEAALRMMNRLAQLNSVRTSRGDLPIRIGIGVNSGDLVVGNMGTLERAEFTAIGDAVNVASRLSDMNKQIAIAAIFISQSTYQQLGDYASELIVENLGDVTVKGKSEPVTVYAVLGRSGDSELQ